MHAGMARSTFYYHLKQSRKPDKYLEVKKDVLRVYNAHHGRMGYRRIKLELRNQGRVINHKTVLKLMQELGIKSLVRAKKYRSYKGEQGKVAPNLLNQDFKATLPDQKWATDITEFKVTDKKLYLSPIIDLFNGEVISYTMTESPRIKPVIDMVEQLESRKTEDKPVILHSDQGWHYQMFIYQEALKRKNIIPSMSRKGNCLDNAVIENFFGTLKCELFYLREYKSISQLKKDIKEYIHYYNHTRIRLNLNGMSPVNYRIHSLNST